MCNVEECTPNKKSHQCLPGWFRPCLHSTLNHSNKHITYNPQVPGVFTKPQGVATGLAEGSAYKFRVSAENLLGVGEPLHTTAPIVAKLPYDPPSAPTQPHVIDSDASFIQLKWAKPSSDGGNAIQGYLVEAKQAGSPDWV